MLRFMGWVICISVTVVVVTGVYEWIYDSQMVADIANLITRPKKVDQMTKQEVIETLEVIKLALTGNPNVVKAEYDRYVKAINNAIVLIEADAES